MPKHFALFFATAVLLVAAGTAHAQHGHGGGSAHASAHGGYHGGYYGGYHGGYHGYNGYYHGGYYGGGFYRPYGYYGGGFYRPYGIGVGFVGIGLYAPYYGSYGYPLSGAYGSYGMGGAYGMTGGYGVGGGPYAANAYPAVANASPPPDAGQPGAGQTPADRPPPDNAGHLQLVVPEDAVVSVDASPIKQTGRVREIVSPPVTPGTRYTYKISVRYTNAAGKAVDDTRDIHFQANDWFTIDFTRPAPAPGQAPPMKLEVVPQAPQ